MEKGDITLADILSLFEEARKDFPELTDKEARICHYAGEQSSLCFGIEFTLDAEPPEAYARVKKPERHY